jgi:hypothetical protein
MEIAMGLKVPIKADSVLSPEIYYGDPFSAVYFTTEDDQFGRITFENLDSLKVSRGENMPIENDLKKGEPYCWVYIVKDSKWLKERHKYESDYYGDSYEFGRDVNEMLTEFNHYIFRFHDEFVEAIARGIWFEKDSEKLFGKELTNGHPFYPLPNINTVNFEAHGLKCIARINPIHIDELKNNCLYCSQTLIEFVLQLDGNPFINNRLLLFRRGNNLISSLRGCFGKKKVEFDNIPTLNDVRPYMEEVAIRRKGLGK